MQLSLSYGGVIYSNWSAEALLDNGVPINIVEQTVADFKWRGIRDERDRKIASSDWTQMPDAPLDDVKKSEFTAYRQALRDVPQKFSDPDAVTWPEKPTF
ncbi:tail fiber assembly protein [Pseudoalteromonas sp. Of7M-16]|uniref:tail fiber assembly protein n=1 Tax=Pseudoalteromonas sp. Of7M-16 TaxID=2917756 RepID=UPI001EF3E891|nr:tail fiber assembly protein [Pseudoalteromonas sp. Of7M-16]MCG7551576.1 phage tail assembly chaperone [Pseudoalteromonas sp. Of7M-16]